MIADCVTARVYGHVHCKNPSIDKVTSRLRNRFSRYLKYLDVFWTDLGCIRAHPYRYVLMRLVDVRVVQCLAFGVLSSNSGQVGCVHFFTHTQKK